MREKITKDILEITNNNILIEIPTGYGKSKIALEKINSLNIKNVLIVIPRLLLVQGWKDEIEKWSYNINPTFVTYVSLPKVADKYDCIVYDEAHHISERCREAITRFTNKYNILLSATVKASLKDELIEVFDNLCFYSIKLREAIDTNVLPDPKVYLLPLRLDNKVISEFFTINDKKPGAYVNCMYNVRWSFIKDKTKTKIHCTELQYYNEISNKIEWWKNKYFKSRNKGVQAKWLQLAGERLKWLSDKKTNLIRKILNEYLKNERVLTFCNSIEQAEHICSNNITSKNALSQDILKAFNTERIHHISAVNMLNEGCNLFNCRVGLYANLNSSETIVKQRTGRILRHKEPIIIIPYYVNTRDEELVKKMLEDYNPELVYNIKNVEEIKL